MILTLLFGCDGEFEAFVPTVRFNRLELRGIDFERIDVDFVFDVDNPNPVGMPLDRFAYALALEEIEILSGNDPDGLQLDPDAVSTLSLPVGLEFGGIYDLVQATRGLDYVGFGLKGDFGFDTDFGPVDITYDEDGTFPALRIPKVTLGKLRIPSFDAEKVDFELDFDVDNDHGSNLDLMQTDFQLSFAGVQVGRGTEDELGTVPGASSDTFTIPFQVDYIDAIDALGAAASGEKLSVDLAATVDVQTPFGPIPLTIDENGDISVEQD